MGNNAGQNMARLGAGERPLAWTANQENALNTWNSWSPADQQAFMGSMGDYYKSGRGNLYQDRKAVDNWWNNARWPASGVAQPTPQPTPQPGPTAAPPPPMYEQPQGYDTMSDWQKWQVDNRGMNPTTELERPDDVSVGGSEYLQGGGVTAAPPPPNRNTIGALQHPRVTNAGIRLPGTNAGGQQGQQDIYQIIDAAYQSVLNRPVDRPGWEFYRNDYQDGMSAARLNEILLDSPERNILQTYWDVVGADPNQQQMGHFMDAYRDRGLPQVISFMRSFM